MGRRKIKIQPIHDDRIKQSTFVKRKYGLMKKAYELAVLCSCDVGLIIFNQKNKMFQFTSSDMSTILNKYSTHTGEYEILSAKDLESVIHFFFLFLFLFDILENLNGACDS